MAETVKINAAKDVYLSVSQVDDAREWINDNGKYMTLVFEALYQVFKRNEALLPLIEKA